MWAELISADGTIGQMTATHRPILAIVGATANGKGALAQEVADATGASLVSVDSRKIYRGMDIGTAKPSKDLQREYDFGMIDCVDPDQTFSAGEYARQARAIVAERIGRGKPVILVGGTGFYLEAFINGLAELPPIAAETRRAVVMKAEREGWESVYRELQEQDPVGATQILPTDTTRLLRAVEMIRETGRPIRAWLADSVTEKAPWPVLVVEVQRPRDELHRRIAARTQKMIDEGLVEETERLRDSGYAEEAPGMATVGYVEAMSFLAGVISKAQMIEQIIIHTRQYAKRQLTWFRHRGYISAIQMEDKAVQRVIDLWESA